MVAYPHRQYNSSPQGGPLLEQNLRQWPNSQPAMDQCTYVVLG